MLKITFCSLSFRSTLISLILMSFWFILPYTVVILPHSSVIRFYSRVIPPCSGMYIPVYSGIFRFICVSFRLVSVYSGTILVHSVSFRHIPVYSVPFLCLVTPQKASKNDMKATRCFCEPISTIVINEILRKGDK